MCSFSERAAIRKPSTHMAEGKKGEAMRVFLLARVTDDVGYKAAVLQCRRALEAMGHSVVMQAAFHCIADNEWYWQVDLAMIETCEALYLMRGWGESQENVRLYARAVEYGLKIMPDTLAEL